MGEKEEMEHKITELVAPILDDMGLELYNVNFYPAGRRSILRIFVDRQGGGVTIADCASVSRELSAILDVEDPIPTSYALEVSSPGATRRLKSERDFERSIGRTVFIETSEPVENLRTFRGVLVAFENDEAVIEVQQKEKKREVSKSKVIIRIPHRVIGFARLEIDEDKISGDKQ